MTVQEMWEQYRQATAALEEDKAVFFAGAEAVVAYVSRNCANPATQTRFDTRRVAIALDDVVTECILYRHRQAQPLVESGKPS